MAVKLFGSQKFFITLENFSETVQKIDAALTKEKISKKESMNAQLLLEETFMRMVNLGKAEGVQVKLSKRFGDLNLTPEIVGAEIFTLALAIFTVSVGTSGVPGGDYRNVWSSGGGSCSYFGDISYS